MTAYETPRNRLSLARFTTGALMAGMMAGMPFTASAQEALECDRIEVVSHSSAGGGTDQTIRMWLDTAAETLGEDMLVVYKQGGGARAAHEYLAGLPADGCALLATTETHLYTIAQGLSPVGIDDLQGVARAMQDPSVIIVRGDSEIENYEDLIAASQEGALNWGVAQVGGTEHIGIARWAEQAGIEFRIVPFGSGGEMITALRSGAIDATLANVSEALGSIQEGELRAIAVLAEEPVEDLPEVPTAASMGHDVSVNTTRGYAVLGDTPPETVATLEQALLDAMESERFQTYLSNSGLNPATSIAGSEEWDAQLKEDYAIAEEAIENLGLVRQ